MRHLLFVLAMSACANPNYVRLYYTEDKAPSLDWDSIGAFDTMGPTLVDKGVNFSVYSKNATKMDLLLFDDPEADQPTQQFEMVRFGDVWNLYVEGVGEGQHYGLVAWGPNWEYVDEFFPGSLEGFRSDVDIQGNRFNPNKLMIDPYAKAVHRDHDWSRGSAASGPDRRDLTYGAAAKGVVVDSKYEWNDQAFREARKSEDNPGHNWEDLVIYKVHLKGLTANGASNQFGVENPGTYRGVGEMAAYLSDLGINAVEFLPVHEKPLDGGYWGYNSLSWFALEVEYSATIQQGREPGGTVDEFKWMVDQLHAEGIEVFIDVVYNHTGEGGLWRTKLFFDDPDGDFICNPGDAIALDSNEVASLLSYRGLDSSSYYVVADAGQGFWSGSTGVGNQVRANNPPVQRIILDSLRYMVDDLHVDGFRFDLAGVLGEPEGQFSQYWTNPTNTTLNAIVDDPLLQEYNTRLIAEPWTTAYDASSQYPASSQGKPDFAWMEWNANFRDWWRSYINTDGFNLNSTQGLDGGAVMTGSFVRYSQNGRKPYHSVNFLTVHDGFTMFDLFSYNEKENGCGPLNPVCCFDACSPWCDPTSGDSNNHSRSWGDEWTKRQMIRNAFVGLFVSQGTPLMLGGDEWMRTKYGNNNSYTTWADNEWNWFRWGEWTSENRNNVFRHRMHNFVQGMIAFRKSHTYALSPTQYGGGMPFDWKSPGNGPADDGTWNSKTIMMHYYDDGSVGEKELAILFNLSDQAVDFTLPQGRDWAIVVDTQSYFDMPGRNGEPYGYFTDNPENDPFQSYNVRLDNPTPVSGVYGVAPGSIVIIEQQ